MNEPGRSFFGEYSELLKEWCVAALCSGTIDWVASKIPIRNGIFATLLSIGQLTITFVTINSVMGIFGGDQGRLLHLTDNWLAYNTIILMSPTAINRLTNSYKKLHFILYGPGKIPQGTADCASGNCGTGNVPATEQKVKPQRDLAETTQSMTLNQRIAALHRERKNN
jgi:hypothetical protein